MANTSSSEPMNKAVITLAGGRYLAGAAVQLMELRYLGCEWPYHVFNIPGEEIPDGYRRFFARMGVEILEVPDYMGHPWTAKRSAIAQFPDTEVLFLDADNIPLINPEFIRQDARYQRTGTVFWRDFGTTQPDHMVWNMLGLEPKVEIEQESGQLLIDTGRCAAGLAQLRVWDLNYIEHYKILHGDKDMWRFAWAKVGLPYEWGSPDLDFIMDNGGSVRVMIQKWDGHQVFHHRVHSKLSIDGDNFWRVGIPLRYFEHLEYVKSIVS